MNSEPLNRLPLVSAVPLPAPTPTPTPTVTIAAGLASLDSTPLGGLILAAIGAPSGTGGYVDPNYVDVSYWDFAYIGTLPIPTPVIPGPVVPTFRAALEARLLSSSALAAFVGSRIFYAALPQTLDLDRHGPALTFMIVGRPTGKILTGSDGTATARVQFSAWAHREMIADQITEVIRNMFDGPQPRWGDGTIKILSCYQEDEVDLPEEPKAGSDQWTYQIASDYSIKHRVSLPTLS